MSAKVHDWSADVFREMKARSIGSSMMPVSLPFSQWSHHRTAS